MPGWDCSSHVNRHSLWAKLNFSYYDLICHRPQSSFWAKAPTHTFLVNLIKRIRLCHQDQITGMWGGLTSRGRLETYTSTEAAPGETFVSWVISRISCMTQPIHKKPFRLSKPCLQRSLMPRCARLHEVLPHHRITSSHLIGPPTVKTWWKFC